MLAPPAPVLHSLRMSGGKFDSGYSFRSSDFRSQPDRWRQQRATRTHAVIPPPPVTVAPAPAAVPEQPVTIPLARVTPPLRSEPDEDGKTACARGDWCSSYHVITEDGETRRIPERAYQPFCPKDRRLLEADLGQLPAQFVHLAAEIGNPVRNGQMIRVPFGPRILIRLDIDTLMRAIEESLSSWHERVADAGSLSYPLTRLSRLQRQMVAVRNAERVLVHRVDALLALGPQPMERTRRVVTERDPKGRATEDVRENEPLDGLDAGMEVFALRYLCRAVLGETKAKPEELVGVPCRDRDGGCGWRSVYRAAPGLREDDPEWWTECARCGDRMTEDEYREWTALCAAYERNSRKEPVTLENLPGVA